MFHVAIVTNTTFIYINKTILPLRFGNKKGFAVPHNGIIFSENSGKISSHKKIYLSMIRCPDNQINASFIDISRIKWLVFLLWSSFFCTTSTVASSEAPADYQPAPGRTDGVPERHQRQWIINPSLQICVWNFNRTGRG